MRCWFVADLVRSVTVTNRYAFAFVIALALPALPAAAQDPAIRTGAACAPVAGSRPSGSHRIIGSMLPRSKSSFAAGEQVVINAGTDRGVQIGQRYFVRHPITFRPAPRAEDTKGWLQIVAVTDDTAIGTIEYTCEAIEVDDHL